VKPLDDIIAAARAGPRHIVLVDGEDSRIGAAAMRAVRDRIARITLVGDTARIVEVLASQGADPHDFSIEEPVASGRSSNDVIIPTINSYVLQQQLPNAQLILYPDGNHGSFYQYPVLFVKHATLFLDT
jgi:phosphotransacetylase